MIQLKLFEDDFKVGDRVNIISKSLGECKPHNSFGFIDRVNIFPYGYYGRTIMNYPDVVPRAGEKYYTIDGWYYLKKDLKKVV